jgi:hypothetical protein
MNRQECLHETEKYSSYLKENATLSITTVSWLVQLREVIAVYSESRTKHINYVDRIHILNAGACGTHSYRCSLK